MLQKTEEKFEKINSDINEIVKEEKMSEEQNSAMKNIKTLYKSG